MANTTGYTDTFNRTVTGGMGPADTGQAYTLTTPLTQYSVAPGTASIAITTSGDKVAVANRHTTDVDITARVALSAIPANNLATVGFAVKYVPGASYYYNGTMMVATGGAISLRVSKVVSFSLSTVTTVSTGLTYVANTFYNLRMACYWSNLLQANVIQLKLWAVGATEPGGWMVNITDGSITPYLGGVRHGFMARDEQTTPGITAKIQNVVSKSYALPMPVSTDSPCTAPGATDTALCQISLADGTFETTASATAWTPSSATFARQQSVVYDGAWSGLLTVTGSPSQMTLRPVTSAQYLPTVTPGQSYTVSMMMRSATAFPSVSAAIDWLDASFGYLSTSSTPTSLISNAWTLVQVTATAPVGAAYASYGPTVTTPTGTQSLYVDNIALLTNCSAALPVYPKQTALQSLAVAADTVMVGLNSTSSLAASYPRVRLSASNITFSGFGSTISFTATEFNVGTSTNLGYDATRLQLPSGIWLLTFEMQMAEASTNYINVSLYGYWNAASPEVDMRSNAAQSNDQGIGGTVHVSTLTYSTDPASTIPVSVTLYPNNTSAIYTIKYCALTAIKISDYFL